MATTTTGIQVGLVGVESNRNGIGARLVAEAGDLQQIREIDADDGYSQKEMLAHFGLGEHTQVDRLEIRWPSGQVDELTDVPADQKIRVFEGREWYRVPEPARRVSLDNTLFVGGTGFTTTVQPAPYEPGSEITQVTADVSALGGGEAEMLDDMGDGTYRLDSELEVSGPSGWKDVFVTVEQSTSLGPYWTRLSQKVAVFPGEDLRIVGDGFGEGWQVEPWRRVGDITFEVFQGEAAAAMPVEGSQFGTSSWGVDFVMPAAPIDPLGFDRLHLAFHPGDAVASHADFSVKLNKSVDLLERVDLEKKEWQPVAISMEALNPLKELIELIRLTGELDGTFDLADMRLVAAELPQITAVLEDVDASVPQAFAPDQNYPNPFNSQTVIRFAITAGDNVELSVFNLAGQKVAALIDGARNAGSYTVRWDGRDDDSTELASGVYVYRLKTEDTVESRKLLLLR